MNKGGIVFLPDGTSQYFLITNVQIKSTFADGSIDAIGSIKIKGRRTRVRSAYRNDQLVWEVCSESEAHRA